MGFKESRRSLLKAAASVCFDWILIGAICVCVSILLFSRQNGLQEAESGRDKRSKWSKGKLMGSILVEKYVSL